MRCEYFGPITEQSKAKPKQSQSKVKQNQKNPSLLSVYFRYSIENWPIGNFLRFHKRISNILTQFHVILTAGLFSASNTGSKLIFLPIGDGDSCSGVGGSKRFIISSKFLKRIWRQELNTIFACFMFSERSWVLFSNCEQNYLTAK